MGWDYFLMTLKNGASSKRNLFLWKGSSFNQKVSQVGEQRRRVLVALGPSVAPKADPLAGEPALLAVLALLSRFSPLSAFNSQFFWEKGAHVFLQVLGANTVHPCFICLFSDANGYEYFGPFWLVFLDSKY